MAVNELELRRRKIIASQPHLETVSGAVATFIGERFPMKSCKVQIEPVQAGSGDPSPENICPITGWTGAKVTMTGKNLFPYGMFAIYTYAWYDGSKELTDASYPVFIRGGNKYVMHWQNTSTDAKPLMRVWRANGELLVNQPNVLNARMINTSIMFNYLSTPAYYNSGQPSSANACYIEPTEDLWLDIRGASGKGTYESVQLELGSIATPYEPYSGKTVDVQFPAEAGTVYGGSLDVTNGVLTVDKGFATLNGSETWREYPSYNGFYTDALNMKYGVRQDGVSNMLVNSKTGDSGQTNAMWLGVNSARLFVIGVYDSMGATLDEFKAYLADHPLQVTYPLANPITYQLTPQEITTIIGTNNVWADTGDISVTYWKH